MYLWGLYNIWVILFFQLLTCYHPGKSQYSTALRVINQPKNRSPDLLSTDSARVFLNPGGEIDGDDYINASWLTGKLFLQGFINCNLFWHYPYLFKNRYLTTKSARSLVFLHKFYCFLDSFYLQVISIEIDALLLQFNQSMTTDCPSFYTNLHKLFC